MADYDLQYQDSYIDVLLATANELKTAGYIYKGVATPSTNPGTPTERVAYLASEPGTYTNFGGIVISSGLYSLTYASGTWTGTQMSAGSDIEVVQTTGDSTTDVMSQKAVSWKNGTWQDLLTEVTWTSGALCATSGLVMTNKNFYVSSHISVVGFDLIKVSIVERSNFIGVVFYDENGYYVKGYNGDQSSVNWKEIIVEVPPTATTIRIAKYANETTYGHPYLYGMVNAGGLVGDGVFIDDLHNVVHGDATRVYPPWTNGYIGSAGTVVANNQYVCSNYIASNKLVSAKCLIANTPISINLYDANYAHIGLWQDYAQEFDVLPRECAYIRMWIKYSTPSTANEQMEILMGGNGLVSDVECLQTNVNMPLLGIKAVTFGDSITWYDRQTYNIGKEQGKTANGYQSYMRKVGMMVDNKGASGNTMLQISNIIKSYANFANMDVCTITSGANDTRKDVPVGNIMDIGLTYNTNTFIGALQSAIDYALTQNDKLKIVLFTPIKGWIYAGGYDPVKTEDGMVSEDYANAIKEVGKLYSLPVLDLFNLAGFNLLTRNIMMNDPEPPTNTLYSLHPSTYGYKRMADIIIPFLRNVIL